MKKLLALLLCLTMLAPAALAEDTPHDALLAAWTPVEDTLETLFTVLDWALAQTETYLETGTWEDLLLARLRAASALSYVDYMVTVPEYALDAKACTALMTDGFDVSFVTIEYANAQELRQSILNSLALLLEELHYGVFWRYDVEHLQAWTANKRESLRIWRLLSATLNNAAALTAPDPAAAFAALAEKYPVIMAEYPGFLDSQAALEERYSALVDEYEPCEAASASILGMTEANLRLLESIFETQDFDLLWDTAVNVPGLPMILPDPSWGDPEIDYMWEDEVGDMCYLQPPSALYPEMIITKLVWRGVSEAAFDEYVNYLTGRGLTFVKDEQEDGERSVYYADGQFSFALVRTEQFALLLSSGDTVCVVPDWYTWR